MGFWGSHSLAQWIPIGPTPVKMDPANSPASTNIKGIAGNNPGTGAIMYELPMPNNPNTFFVGSVAGGVWQSGTNSQGSTTWTPIGDNLGSLSIGAMAFNSSINSAFSKDLWVGAGNQSALGGTGGPLTGLSVYDTSSKTWRTPSGNSALTNLDITQVSAYGNSIVVGTKGNSDTGTQYLMVSTDGGSKFVPINNGLNAGEITSLVRDPTNVNRLYAAVSNTANLSNTGVYRSIDGGLSWVKLSSLNVQQNTLPNQQMTAMIRLSISNDGVLVADLVNPVIGTGGVQGALNGTANTAAAVYRTSNQGDSWTSMGTPTTSETVRGAPYTANLYTSGQYNIHGRVLVDPNNSSVIYISGDSQGPKALIENGIPTSIGGSIWSGRLFRGNYDPNTGLTTWTPITDNYANNSGPHADSRFMMIDGQGNLMQADDAGIYKLTNPQNRSGIWQSSNFNLQIGEVHSAGWNSLTHTAVTAAQDNGAGFQNNANQQSPFTVLSGGDGGVAAVNSSAGVNQAALYTSSQNFGGLSRSIVNSNNALTSVTYLRPYFDAGGTTYYLSNSPNSGGGESEPPDRAETYNEVNDALKAAGTPASNIPMPFIPVMVLNASDKTRFAIGGFEAYVGKDTLALTADLNTSLQLPVSQVTNITKVQGGNNLPVRSMAFGAFNNANALLTGTGTYDNNQLKYSTATIKPVGSLYYNNDVTSTAQANLLYTDASNYGIQATLFDRNLGTNQIYFTTGVDIFRDKITGGGTTWALEKEGINITGNLTDLNGKYFIYRGLDQVYKYGVNALVTGGVNMNPSDLLNTNNYIYTLRDPTNLIQRNWESLFNSLPNAPIYGIQYSSVDDVLLVNTLGRGVFMLPDVTTYFTEASELVFGQANNDSAPNNNQLLNGLSLADTTFNRKLTKTGTGTLSLVGRTGEYALGTFLNGGTTIVDADANLGVAGTGVTFDGGALKYYTSFALNRPLTLNAGGGTIDSNSLGIIQGNQAIDGVGQLSVTGAGTYTFVGANTYSGGTLVKGNATVGAQQDNNFGTAGTAVILDSGKIKYNTAFALNREIILNPGGGTMNTNLLGITQGSTVISGAGALSIAGGGTYTLEGANTYAGGTTVTDSSTINAQQDTNLGAAFSKLTLSNGTVNLLPSFTAYEAGKLNRPLGVIGSNNLLNTSNNAFAYMGGEISGGGILSFQGTPMTMGADLKLNAYWNANFAVPSGLVLRGTGGVIGNLTVNGTLYPGNSPGTFTVAGSAVQSPGSSFAVDIDGSGTGNGIGNYSRLVITGAGNTYTANGLITPTLRNISGNANNNYSPPVGQGFKIVSAPGGVYGSFIGIVQPVGGLLPGTRFDAVYGSTALSLYATPTSYANIAAAGVASNSNRNQTGVILEQIRPNAGVLSSNVTTKFLFDSLAPQTSNSLPVALDQLAGVSYAQSIGMNYENTKFLIDENTLAVTSQRRGEGGHLINTATSSEEKLGENKEEVWGKVMGRQTTWRGDGTGSTLNDTLGGLIGGIQKHLDPQSLAGLSIAYASGNSSISNSLGSGLQQNIQLMGYGSLTADNGFFVQGSAGGGSGQINANRNVSMMATNYNALIYTANLAANALVGWGNHAKDAIGYEAGLGVNYMGMHNFGFNDKGGLPAYQLSANATDNYSFTTSIGGSASIPFEAQGIDWRAIAGVSLAHEFGDTVAYLNTTLLGNSMQLQSGSIGRDRLNVGLGLTGMLTKQTKVGLNIVNQSAQNWNATAITASARLEF